MVVVVGWSLAPGAAIGQSVRVAAEQEAFHQTAGGKRLGTVMRDTELRVTGRQGPWTEVVLEGWVWSRSVAPSGRQGFDLVVSEAGGENLRTAPGGRIAARLFQGFLLERVEEGDQWIRVRRTGWIQAAALASAEGGSPLPDSGAAAENGPGVAGLEGADGGEEERVLVGSTVVQLRTSPEGADTLGAARPGADLVVVERRRGWARVRLEGWVPAADLTAVPDSMVVEATAADLKANPDRYAGRRVRWEVQFISLERAEAPRSDFYEGEPFILARAPDPSEGFVYLAVPQGLLPEVREVDPLQTIGVLARVRTGRSALMGAPVLELLAIYDARRRR